jgi:hypothetical protein
MLVHACKPVDGGGPLHGKPDAVVALYRRFVALVQACEPV